MSYDPSALSAIEGLVRARQKVQAIKAWRELTSHGLKEAKDAVEHFERFGSWRPTDAARLAEVHGGAAHAAEQTRAFADAAARAPALLSAAVSEIVEVARQGQKIEAIKRYRQHFGVGLKEAKDAVEALTEGGPAPAPPETGLSHRAPPHPSHAQTGHAQQQLVHPPPLKRALDGDAQRARQVLADRLQDARPPLVVARGECGLFKGHLLLTEDRLCFVADRYGTLELTENLERKEIESVDMRRDPFGFELTVLAGFHSAHFSELDEHTARTFAALLKGEAPPPIAAPAAAESTATHPHDAWPSQTAHTNPFAHAAPSTPANASGAGSDQTPALPVRKPFRLGSVLVQTLLAGLPVALLGSAWRFLPMEDFPTIAYSVLYWASLALGGAFRGHGIAMLKVALLVGAMAWAIGVQAHMHEPAQWLGVALLGAAYGRAQPSKSTVLGAVLSVAVSFLNAILVGLVSLIDFVPTLGFAFWFVHFAVEDFRASRPPAATPAKA